MIIRLAFVVVALALWSRAAVAQISLPIYIEDNHAGSFYWLAEHLDLEEPVTLLHFDAHSDASGVFDSDVVRRQLRRVASKTERGQHLERWRERGVVQCFSWIEALMPAPIVDVIWIPGDQLANAERDSLGKEAGDLLDGHLEAAPRAAGPLRSRYRTIGFEQLRREFEDGRPLVATIDLDYFAGLSGDERVAAFERVWSFVSERRSLRAITVAISRPYLTSDAEADALVQLVLAAAKSLPTARLHFEPYRRVGGDRSLRAQEYRAQGKEVPAFDVAKSSAGSRALMLAAREQIAVRHESQRWNALLDAWAKEAPAVLLAIDGHQPSTDNVWRISANARGTIKLQTVPWYAQADRVEWIVEQPARMRCNLVATRHDEEGFAHGAPPRPRWRDVTVAGVDSTLPLDALQEFFDPATGCGAVRVRARATFGDLVRETPAMEIRQSRGSGIRAALLEQFGLPYLFGSGALRDGSTTGPETGWGADCANFLVYALRRQGERVPWSDPKQLRRHLQLVADDVTVATETAIETRAVEDGVFIHLDSHVAALMEDRPPLGIIDAGDVVAHQLEGAPELVELGELLERRSLSRFDVLRVLPKTDRTDVLVGGDVMLGRSIGTQILHGASPFADMVPTLARADVKLANLECVVSQKGQPTVGLRFPMRAPDEAARLLASAGFGAVSLANNHAADFGGDALLDSIERLRAANVGVVGAGRTPKDAYAAKILTASSGRRIAAIAINDVGREFRDRNTVVASSSNRAALREAIMAARANADAVLALVHWGDENSAVVNERQRELARWLINAGVDVISGSHPHCVQPFDYYRGRPIAYSLGNLVFDGAPTVREWNRGELLELDLTAMPYPRTRLIPVQLNERGFPSHRAPRQSVAGSP